MQGRTSRIILAFFFGALLVTPVMYKRIAGRHAKQQTAPDPSAVLGHYGFHFQESAKSSGINFRHTSPQLDPKLQHIMQQVASMGAAVSVVDYDGDGWA